jgi:hypothetical protein
MCGLRKKIKEEIEELKLSLREWHYLNDEYDQKGRISCNCENQNPPEEWCVNCSEPPTEENKKRLEEKIEYLTKLLLSY